MVQFKRTFLGQEQRDYLRATTVPEVRARRRASTTISSRWATRTRHHTFFEMLGNFSFGDYFKREAIAFAWEFVTGARVSGLAPDRLRVTVHQTDDEARALWREVAGLPDRPDLRPGGQGQLLADGGHRPCGPCSEIYVDLEWNESRRAAGAAVIPTAEFEDLAEAGRFLEIWNLVFMQFDRSADGKLTPLPRPSVDTGAGLERIAARHAGRGFEFSHRPLPAASASGRAIGRAAL